MLPGAEFNSAIRRRVFPTYTVYVSYGTVADLRSVELGKPFKQMWTLGSVKVPS